MRYLSGFIFLCYISSVSAQNHYYGIRYINQADGLLHNNVLGLSQDAKGYIWIVTSNGLQRYDGSRFINYASIITNATGGRTDGADIYASPAAQEVRVMKRNQVQKLNLQTNQASIYGEQDVLPNLADLTTFRDENDVQWLAGENGVFTMQRDRIISSRFNIHPLTNHSSNLLAADTVHHQLWLADGVAVNLLDQRSKKVFSQHYNPLHHPLLAALDSLNPSPKSIMIDSRQNYWIATWGDFLYRFNSYTGKLRQYSLASLLYEGKVKKRNGSLLVSAFYEDRQHNIWMTTENAGLFLYRSNKDNFESITVDNELQGQSYNFKINCLMQDKDENIWLGTDKGITVFNPYIQSFNSLTHLKEAPSVPRSEILSFFQCRTGDLLIGTWGGGISIYDEHFNFKKNVTFDKEPDHNKVWCFIEQEDGMVWAGCQHGYIHVMNPLNGKINTLHPPELENSTVRCMTRDDKGNIWLGLHNGNIALYNKQEHKFYKGNASVNNAAVCKILIDQSKQFWVTSERGFKRFDPVARSFIRTYMPGSKAGDITATGSQGAAVYNDSMLIITTVYGGVGFFNTHTGTFSSLRPGNTTLPATTYAIHKDVMNNFWFTTDYDLYKMTSGSHQLTRYQFPAGMLHTSFNANDFFELKNGDWITASTTEIISFNPQSLVQHPLKGNTEITGFKIYDQPVFIDSFITLNKPLILSYNQNFITIEFALLSFTGLEQVSYFYQLSDVNKNWVNANDRNFASYTNLQPGTYTFKVRTQTGTIVSPTSSFTIIILPPWWRTWWFVTFCAAVLTLLSYYFIKRSISNARHKAEMKQKVAETEMMALRAQMNPHFIFNCLNSIDNFIQVGEKEKATIYLSRFAKLIRAILENSRNSMVSCSKDMETLELYLELEALRFSNRFSYKLNIAPEIWNGDYKVPPLVIQPFVENAIHHGLFNKPGHDKTLLIEVYADSDFIHYRVEDNGIGRKQSAIYNRMNKPYHQSMGMQITTDRIDLYNNFSNGSVKITDLYDSNNNPCGTRVDVQLIIHS